MKLIPLRKTEGTGTVEVIKQVLGVAPQGVNLEAWDARFRVLGFVKSNADPDKLLLEDADHAVLVQAIRSLNFSAMTEDMHGWLHEIIDAAPPPAA